MTNVKGYFNPNPYRVNVTVSELNISFPLEPQQFIKIRNTGQKVNDPIFDRFVGAKMLSPELADRPVLVVKIPTVAAPVAVHPGYVVGQGHKDATGKWVPPSAASQPAGAAAGAAAAIAAGPESRPIVASNPSIKGMSMEEARRQGYIGKQRLVSEDYGAAESDGAPTRGDNIPPIKYSMEAPAPRARHGELPKEIVEAVRADVAPVVKQLADAARNNPEKADLSRKAAEEATRQQMGTTGVTMFRRAAQQVRAAAKAIVSQPKPASAAPVAAPVAVTAPVPKPRGKAVAVVVAGRKVADVLPAPPMEELGDPAQESPLVGGADDLPAPNLEEQEPPVAAEPVSAAPVKQVKKTAAQAKQYICPACGKGYPFRSYLVRHVQRTHADRMQELMELMPSAE